jgi:plastocyanin
MTPRTFAPRRGALILPIVALLVAACSSSGTSSPSAVVSVEDGAVTVSADELAFDAGTIEATAGEAFTITLDNLDSVPHNISIYTEEGGEEIVVGEIIDAGDSVEVEVPALEAGEYFFVCDLHTTMNGTVVVTASGS